ncbi:MAG: hypothetical protein IJB47_06480 [Oscillospiraceae bacterium]|nr:hypothetical protein [Oscillospiraceae bacterium]
MPDIYIPTLHSFAMKNPFTGSCGQLRFKIVPQVQMLTQKEVDMENSTIFAQYWHGPLCYEKSQMEGEATFPMSEDGREALKKWLEEKV